jgi:hypothetical protein
VVAFAVIRSSGEEAPRVPEHIVIDGARDEYPIRQSWTFVVPTMPVDQSAAREER